MPEGRTSDPGMDRVDDVTLMPPPPPAAPATAPDGSLDDGCVDKENRGSRPGVGVAPTHPIQHQFLVGVVWDQGPPDRLGGGQFVDGGTNLMMVGTTGRSTDATTPQLAPAALGLDITSTSSSAQ